MPETAPWDKEVAPWDTAKPEATPVEKPAEGGKSPPSLMERMETGFMDPFYGAAQLGARMGPTDVGEAIGFDPEHQKQLIESVDKEIADREHEYRGRRRTDSIDWARMAGSVANPINYVGMLTGGPMGAAAAGATAGMLQPTPNADHFVQEKTKDALFGAAFGKIGEVVPQAIGKVVSPIMSKAAAELLRNGVQLTPGQLAGGILRRAEEAAKSFPILGSFIRGAEGRSIQTFNNSVGNQVLEPIGERVPSTVNAGHDLISYVGARLSDKYDQLLPTTRFGMDPQFATDVQNLRLLVSEMPEPQAKQFEAVLQNRVATRLGSTGTMDGITLKQVESELTNFSSQYRNSSDAAQRQLATAISELRNSIRSALARQNPQVADALQKINSGYAMYTRMQSAAARRAGSEGVFTPMDLLSAIKTADRSVRKGDFAKGDALMQEYAEFGQFLLPGKMPDSGSPERIMWDMLGIAGGGFLNPKIPLGLGAASIPYTKTAGKALSQYAQPSATRQTVRSGIEKAAPLGAVPAAEAGEQVELQ